MSKKKRPDLKKSLPKKPGINIEYLALFLCTVISIGALVNEYYLPQKPDPPKEEASQSTKKITTTNAFFYTEVLFNRNKTYITFPYRFDGNPQTMWLMLQTQAGQYGIKRLVMHPLLYSLDWPQLTEGDITLYQRTKRYTTLASFLQNPPAESMILLDNSVLSIIGDKFNQAKTLTEETKTLEPSINYILTTYKPAVPQNGWLAYESLLNTETAEKNTHNELVWQLQVPNASESTPFYLGEVHVDFRD